MKFAELIKKRVSIASLLFIGLCLISSASLSQDIYVSPGGSGDGSILSPTSLQSALDSARTNGFDDTLYLQQGTYDASTSGANTFEYGAASNDNMSVVISGGWNNDFSTQSTDPTLTLLDGGNNAPVVHILADANGVSYDFELDTLTIQNGLSTTSHGAGIRAYTGTSGTAGMINLTVRNCMIRNNDAKTSGSYYGGGLYSNTYFEIYDSTFDSNSAYSGAAIAVFDVPDGDLTLSPLIHNTTLDANDTIGGWQGSAVFNFVSLRVVSSAFTNNTGSGSPIYTHTNSSLDVSNSVFSGNRIVWWGSAISFWDAGGTISNSLFYDNVAGVSPG
ncbi:MAG: hypothetical protein KJO91_06405, partial [Gammaproteobacteria bacterium]|nr:hypothetical protein [Gammaproteobacteria bacterium]